MSSERKLMGTTDATTAANYIEDVFSTYLYTGNGASQTINNGIDLSTKGGLVWLKPRAGTYGALSHSLFDTVRGAGNYLATNTTAAEVAAGTRLTAFNSNGFTLDSSAYNQPDSTYVSWTFREQAKFFDVVTYTGTGAARTIAHNLGSVPGMIIVKERSAASNWMVYHRGLTSAQYVLSLNTTNQQSAQSSVWNSTAPTSTVFSVGADLAVNDIGATYVAYLFAHDAGGFGASGTDNVISCGSYTGNGSASGPTITLGYEPQYLMIKSANLGDWHIMDNMRGMPVGSADALLQANLSNSEVSNDFVTPTATGFNIVSTSPAVNASSTTYIYMAIRRGPMRTPTSGTSVFSPIARAGTGAVATVTGVGFTPDMSLTKGRIVGYGGAGNSAFYDRLRGANSNILSGTSLQNESFWQTNAPNTVISLNMNGFTLGVDSLYVVNKPPVTYINYFFGRAPGFFDEVCYTGTGANTTQTHNLAAVPELMIVKGRSGTTDWQVYSSALANTEYLVLNTTAAKATGATRWNSTTPTSSVFSLGTASEVNTSAATYVAYLFATLSGVSKVGSYTGTGAAQTINCGFTAGARFVLIKRTDSTGDWYTYDTARGMVSGTDPYSLLNTTAAEVNANYVFTSSTGFSIQAAAPAGINGSGGTFIYLAIA